VRGLGVRSASCSSRRIRPATATWACPPPVRLEVLFHSPLTCQHRLGFADVTYYTAPSEAGVFSAGNQWWICGVDPG